MCTQRTACLTGYLSPGHRDAPVDGTVKLILSKLTACSQGPPFHKAKGKRWRRPEKSSHLRLFLIPRWWSTSLISLRPFAQWCVHLFMGVSDHSLTGALSHLHSFTSSVSAWLDPSEMEHFLWHLAFSPKPLNVCHINLSVRSAQRFVASALRLMTFRCVQINSPILLVMYDVQTNPDS